MEEEWLWFVDVGLRRRVLQEEERGINRLSQFSQRGVRSPSWKLNGRIRAEEENQTIALEPPALGPRESAWREDKPPLRFQTVEIAIQIG
jgi:hypothetical protein